MNVEEFLKQFGIKEKFSYCVLGRSFFIFDDKKLLKQMPLYAGECIAHERGVVLVPSVDLLQHIGRAARKRVVLSHKGEWLFICGRDIFGKSIVSHNNPVVGDRVVVLNKHNECRGYGDVVAPLEEKKVVVRRLFDIGDLLRRERKSKKVS